MVWTSQSPQQFVQIMRKQISKVSRWLAGLILETICPWIRVFFLGGGFAGLHCDLTKDSMPRACRRGQGLPSNLPKHSLCLHLVVIDCMFVVRKASPEASPRANRARRLHERFRKWRIQNLWPHACCISSNHTPNHTRENIEQAKVDAGHQCRRWTPVFFCGCASNAPRFAQGQSKGGSCKRAQDP